MSWRSKSGTSGFTQIWKFWRHCCFRYGWYPLLVALVVTSACALDLYSFVSCDFLQIVIGFNPSNSGWNQSTANIGIYYYETGAFDGKFGENLAPGCQMYSESFEQQFINGDKTWQASRIMGMISAISGMLVAVTSWLLVITPVPACFVWPGIMLPGVLLAFIAEGSKFIFFDISICNSQVWYPSGTETSPQAATSCTMGVTGYYIISACIIFFVSLVMICLKAPLKRMLKEDYGSSQGTDFMAVALPVNSGSDNEVVNAGSDNDDPERQKLSSNLNLRNREGSLEGSFEGSFDDDEDLDLDLQNANTSMIMSMSRDESVVDPSVELSLDSFSGSAPSLTSLEYSRMQPNAPADKELHALAAKVGDKPLADKVKESDSDELINQCVTELAQSFMVGDGVVEKSTDNNN